MKENPKRSEVALLSPSDNPIDLSPWMGEGKGGGGKDHIPELS